MNRGGEKNGADVISHSKASVFAVRQHKPLLPVDFRRICTLLRRTNLNLFLFFFFFPQNGRGSGQ